MGAGTGILRSHPSPGCLYCRRWCFSAQRGHTCKCNGSKPVTSRKHDCFVDDFQVSVTDRSELTIIMPTEDHRTAKRLTNAGDNTGYIHSEQPSFLVYNRQNAVFDLYRLDVPFTKMLQRLQKVQIAWNFVVFWGLTLA